jgi:hypothetical protein
MINAASLATWKCRCSAFGVLSRFWSAGTGVCWIDPTPLAGVGEADSVLLRGSSFQLLARRGRRLRCDGRLTVAVDQW